MRISFFLFVLYRVFYVRWFLYQSKWFLVEKEFFKFLGKLRHVVGDICGGDDPLDFVIEDDGEFFDFIGFHHFCCLFNPCARVNGFYVFCHDVFYFCPLRVSLINDNTFDDISFGEDSDDDSVVHDDEASDAEVFVFLACV